MYSRAKRKSDKITEPLRTMLRAGRNGLRLLLAGVFGCFGGYWDERMRLDLKWAQRIQIFLPRGVARDRDEMIDWEETKGLW